MSLLETFLAYFSPERIEKVRYIGKNHGDMPCHPPRKKVMTVSSESTDYLTAQERRLLCI